MNLFSRSKKVKSEAKTNDKIYIVPLGGLGEIGKNMTAICYGESIIVIDAGLMFPEDDMLGIDLVIPDISFLLERKEQVKAIFLTHGHEDHIGALPYVLKQLNVPVYGTALTLGICKGRMEENGVSTKGFHVIAPGDTVRKGPFVVDFIRVNHSIPDSVALSINTPIGRIIHTGDFKIDHTPVDGQVTEFNKFAEYGDAGVLCLLADSTNAEREGFTPSEKIVGKTFDEEFAQAQNRIIVATFSSNVHRIQQVIDSAVKFKRKVAIIGRSMENVARIAIELGYLKVPKGVLIDIGQVKNYTSKQIVVVTTGSQGEPMSALTRMSQGEHKKISIVPGDTIIISATPIPGNEKMVSKTVDNLYKLGANVVYERSSGVHVSGHASQEELKLMHNLVRPKFFVPVHGEFRHLIKHARLANSLGMSKDNIVIAENGIVIELTQNSIRRNSKVQAGKVMVDGLGVGDVGSAVLRERKELSENGIFVAVLGIDRKSGQLVNGPEIFSQGFIFVRDAEELIIGAKEVLIRLLEQTPRSKFSDRTALKLNIIKVLEKYLFDKTHRRPVTLPIFIDN